MVDRSVRGQGEMTLREFVVLLWSRRKFVVLTTALATSLATGASFLIDKSYQASVVVVAVTDPDSNGRLGSSGGLVSQIGGLASLAGLSVGADNKKAESLAVLESEALTEDFITKNDLLPVIYQNRWDPMRKTWKVSEPEKVPTLWKANQYFKSKVRAVSVDSKSGLVTVSVKWKDPNVAARWANSLVAMANDYLRSRAIQEAERNIAYLNDQASKTDVTGVKQAIYEILQSEIDKAMLARGNLEYALKVVDPAFAPEIASSPKRAVWVSLGFLGGLFLSIVLIFFREAWRVTGLDRI